MKTNATACWVLPGGTKGRVNDSESTIEETITTPSSAPSPLDAAAYNRQSASTNSTNEMLKNIPHGVPVHPLSPQDTARSTDDMAALAAAARGHAAPTIQELKAKALAMANEEAMDTKKDEQGKRQAPEKGPVDNEVLLDNDSPAEPIENPLQVTQSCTGRMEGGCIYRANSWTKQTDWNNSGRVERRWNYERQTQSTGP